MSQIFILSFVSPILATLSLGWNVEQKLNYKLDSPRLDVRNSHMNKHSHEFYQIDGLNANNEKLKSYFKFLSNVSEDLIGNIHENIIYNYGLDRQEVSVIDSNFNNTNYEYQIILQDYFNKMAKSSKYNDSTIFLLDFTDLSNFLIQSVVESNLSDLKETSSADIWYDQPLKYTILRQQMKVVMNVMETEICNKLSVCIGNNLYSEFIVECLRNLLNTNENNLKSFFLAVSDILFEYMHTVRSNYLFRKEMERVAQSGPIHQRNAIDFVDEVFTGQETNIFKTHLKYLVNALRDLMKFIDNSYDLNYENVDKLDDISRNFYKYNNGTDIKYALEELVKNMEMNVKIWPLQIQRQLDYLWAQVTQIAARF